MPKLIIGLTGQAGCGKGTAVGILKKEYGADYFRFSAILLDIATRLNIEKSRENFIKLSICLRKEFGEDVLSYAIEHDTMNSPKDIVVIDGIRRLEDIVALEPLDQFKLIAIDVPAKIRFERLKKRGEKSGEADMAWEQFLAEENAETERTIPGVMARASKTISNTGTPEDLAQQVHEMMSALGFQPTSYQLQATS
jgi:dephospho-CoA kinase